MAFLPGEIVQLKSGGPLMTIIKVEDAKRITCMWYAQEQGEFRTHVFEQAGSTRSTSRTMTTRIEAQARGLRRTGHSNGRSVPPSWPSR